MNKNLQKIKGFTLVELIVVMAIFSIIMLAVLKLIDPVEKVMNNTSVQEKNAAYVDNMQDYLKSSMKYAEFMRVYEGDFCEPSGGTMTQITEQKAVESFVKTYFDGRVNSSYNLIDGKIRVLKIDNENDGKIYEDIWEFTAGDTYVHEEPAFNPLDPPVKTTEVNVPPVVNYQSTSMVINPDYYKDYSFYFKLGYNDFIPLQNDSLAYYSLKSDPASVLKSDPKAEYYYGELVPGKDYNGNNVPFGQDNFSVSVVTYQKDNKIGCSYDDGTNPVTDKIVFKSPFYMSSSNMALLNIISMTDDKYYQIKQDNDGTNVTEDGKVKLEQTDIKGLPFEYFKYDTGENIYFIYALTSELNY